MNQSGIRSRWAAVGAAVAITLGAGGIGLVSATSPAGATAYSPIEPCRIADTRAGEFNVGPRSTPIGPGEQYTITAHGDNGECTGIPTSATGLQLNVTSLNATTGTFLAIWGSGDRPNSSNLNPQPGQPPIPNAVTTGLTGAGAFNIFNAAGSVDFIVDVVGFYSDHHHDDRYYTEAEVDAALGAKADVADVATHYFVIVDIDGNITRQSGGISVDHTGAGDGYDVNFPSDVTSCGWSATLGGTGLFDSGIAIVGHLGIAVRQGFSGGLFDATVVPDELLVSVYDNDDGSVVESPFALVVTCP